MIGTFDTLTARGGLLSLFLVIVLCATFFSAFLHYNNYEGSHFDYVSRTFRFSLWDSDDSLLISKLLRDCKTANTSDDFDSIMKEFEIVINHTHKKLAIQHNKYNLPFKSVLLSNAYNNICIVSMHEYNSGDMKPFNENLTRHKSDFTERHKNMGMGYININATSARTTTQLAAGGRACTEGGEEIKVSKDTKKRESLKQQAPPSSTHRCWPSGSYESEANLARILGGAVEIREIQD